MCGIYITNDKSNNLSDVLNRISLRGPDLLNQIFVDGINFNHALLSLTGPPTPQPYINDDFVILFNGEIYNYMELGSYQAEVVLLSNMYAHYGLDFVKFLDGEYVIVIYEFKTKDLIIITDVFGTKPIFLKIDQNECFHLASVPLATSGCSGQRNAEFPANSITVFDTKCNKISRRFTHTFFDLEQKISSYDRWCELFTISVQKRVKSEIDRKNIFFMGLSTGYDSGLIAATLKAINNPLSVISVSNEHIHQRITDRIKYLGPSFESHILPDLRSLFIPTHELEDFQFKIYSSCGDYQETNSNLKTDQGAQGLAYISGFAKNIGKKIYISGSGADEIYSDYGFSGQRIVKHSNFGGEFPENLESIFPWPSFYGSTQRSYLMKEELVGGSFGIEARYPFLDVKLTQEWLSLKPKLKNLRYKSAIANMLEIFKFPNTFNEKLGF